MGAYRMKKSTFYSKIGVQIPKIAFFSISSISTLLKTLKIHILLDKMVLRKTKVTYNYSSDFPWSKYSK